MLLPPDLRDWVEEDDLVHFIIEAVDRLPLEVFQVNHRGSGSDQFPPHPAAAGLTLLLYCYANGVFSSRKMERSTYRDVSVRNLTGDTHPDHDTICTFRRKTSLPFQTHSWTCWSWPKNSNFSSSAISLWTATTNSEIPTGFRCIL